MSEFTASTAIDAADPRAMRRLWKRLADTYGAWFTRDFGVEPNDAWVSAMRGVTLDEVAIGLSALPQRYPDRAPNPLQFWQLCRNPQGSTAEQRALEARMQHKALPGPESLAGRSKEGRRWLAFWYIEGMRPQPEHVTAEQLDEWLGDANLDEMRAKVRTQREAILATMR